MTWSVYVERFETADGSSPTYFQGFSPTNNMILSTVKMWIAQYDNPTYTSFTLKLYSNNSGAPRAVIATSTTSWTKATAFNSQNSGLSELYFNFDEIPLRGGETYHLVLSISGYTATTTSFLGLKKSFPDPVYQTGVDMTFEGLVDTPYDFIIIGAEK